MKYSLTGYHKWYHLVSKIQWQISTLILVLINLSFLNSIKHNRPLDITLATPTHPEVLSISLSLCFIYSRKKITSCWNIFCKLCNHIVWLYCSMKTQKISYCYTWYLGNFKHKQDGHMQHCLVTMFLICLDKCSLCKFCFRFWLQEKFIKREKAMERALHFALL